MSLAIRKLIAPTLAAAVCALPAGMAGAENNKDRWGVAVHLSGFREVPVISTTGTGTFIAKKNPVTGDIDYELSYDKLQGIVTQAHIHIGPAQNTGGIAIWLCQTTTNAAPVTVPVSVVPTCVQSGTVSGTITAAHVVGPVPQLITAGQLDEVLAAIRAGLAYVNVHTGPNTTSTPPSPGVGAGEIRGQLRSHGH